MCSTDREGRVEDESKRFDVAERREDDKETMRQTCYQRADKEEGILLVKRLTMTQH